MKIGEMVSATATNIETVRYYEKIVLLPPSARDATNYRSYGKDHLARLSFIRRARDLGFTLDQVCELLDLADDRARSCAAVGAIASTHLAKIGPKLAYLQALRVELSRLIGDCRKGTGADCLLIETLAPTGMGL